METEDQRWLVHYSGHVQGVGFRFTVASLARDFQVAGYVKNLPDGQVRLEVEGRQEELDRFLAAIAAEFPTHIHHVEVQPGLPFTGQAGFSVRY